MHSYKFFIFGCIFTSLTWSISLFMYWKLNSKHTDLYSQKQISHQENNYDYVKKHKHLKPPNGKIGV